MGKRLAGVLVLCVTALALLCGCGDGGGGESAGLAGSCEEILNKVYENADFDQEFRDSMDSYVASAIEGDTEEYILGTNEVKYTDSVCSTSMVTATAYQCVILRLAEGEDPEAAKETLREHADPRKWICVEAESVILENIGDVVLYVMAEKNVAEAVRMSFLALGES